MTLHAVILAGGSGTRFWPLSREYAPKQLLSVFGEDSLLTSTIRRARQVISAEGSIHIVVGEELYDELRNHILAQDEEVSTSIDYIIEPAARNTAPALALAAATVAAGDTEGTVIMLPADHICEDGARWQATIAAAVDGAANGSLVTIGLHPTRPDTGYGYIYACDEVVGTPAAAAAGRLASAQAAIPIQCFVEKPDLATAERYLAEGGYYWNSGIVVARADAILHELEAVAAAHPDGAAAGNLRMVETACSLAANPTNAAARTAYAQLLKVSFDNAALELSPHVSMVPTDLDWSDVGSLLSLEALAVPNAQGTRVIGQGIDVDSTDTLNYSTQRLVATLGLDNVVVVDTEDATLVAARDRVQEIRAVVDALAQRGAPELKQNKTSLRPWGSWTLLTRGIGFQVKEIMVTPGSSLSLQSHQQRSEHWIVVAGEARVEIGDALQTLHAGQSAFIPLGVRHRLGNVGEEPLRIVEVATGSYLGEDDIERYDDVYGR
ncbi:MAG: mannose-1-phosphate guanylyltransferase/mannose-6-phosphate isomerase [Actinomycetes bacterium]|jgi:mannose-1-phosphate guanylyltransferase/mannose-6-phosphate isomerase|nr:mannose-1-phosphate guanylyltransferase/mannose-6-phosphate isomerase [Actinomycetes bacterium]